MLTLFLSLFWFKVGRSSTHRTMNKDLEGNEQTLDSWLFVLFKCATHPECWWKFNETWRRSYLSSTPPQDKAATAYCLSWTKAQFKRMSENPEEYSTNQAEFLIAHFGWKDEERMISMSSQKKSVARRKKNGTCVFFLFCFFRCVCLEQRSYEYFLTSGKLRWKRSKGSSAPWLSLSLSRGSLERWLSLFISAQNRKHPSSPHRIQQCLANYPSL